MLQPGVQSDLDRCELKPSTKPSTELRPNERSSLAPASPLVVNAARTREWTPYGNLELDWRLVDWRQTQFDRRMNTFVWFSVLGSLAGFGYFPNFGPSMARMIPGANLDLPLEATTMIINTITLVLLVFLTFREIRDLGRYRPFDAKGNPIGHSMLEDVARYRAPSTSELADTDWDGSFCGRLVKLRLASNLITPGSISKRNNPRELLTLTAVMYSWHPFTVRIYRQSGMHLLSFPPPPGLRKIEVSALPAGPSLLFSGAIIECDDTKQFIDWLERERDFNLASLLNDCLIESVEIQYGCLRVGTSVGNVVNDENLLSLLETMSKVLDSFEKQKLIRPGAPEMHAKEKRAKPAARSTQFGTPIEKIRVCLQFFYKDF